MGRGVGGFAGRHMGDHQDAGGRDGSVGPRARGNVTRHVVDDLNAEGEWAAKTVKRPPHRPPQ